MKISKLITEDQTNPRDIAKNIISICKVYIDKGGLEFFKSKPAAEIKKLGKIR